MDTKVKDKRSVLIKNAIRENTRYLTGDDTYKLYKYMTEQGLIEKGKIICRSNDESGNQKLEYKDTIIANFENDTQKMLDYFEEHEYNKSYKYGVIREIEISYDDLSKKLDDLLKKSDIRLEADNYDRFFRKPRLAKYDDLFCLKFSYFVGTKSNSFAFPVLVSIYPKKKLLIITFDSIPYNYYTKKDFYQDIAKSAKAWVERFLGITTKEIKLLEMVQDIINIKNKEKKSFEDVTEYIRDGFDKRGGRFKMIADDNDEMSFLDQLSKIAESLSTEDDKNKLRKFIHDIANNMNFIERGLTWKQYNGKKTKMTMTFRENFIPNEMLLIHFYDNNWERERVVYGIEYIINYKTKIAKGTECTQQVS